MKEIIILLSSKVELTSLKSLTKRPSKLFIATFVVLILIFNIVIICSNSILISSRYRSRMNSVVQFTLFALALGCVGHAVGFCPEGMSPIPCEDAVGTHRDAVIEAVSSIGSPAELCGHIADYYDGIVGYAVENGILPAAALDMGCADAVGTYLVPAMAELPALEDVSVADICENIPPVVAEVAVDLLISKGVITPGEICVAA